MVLRDIYLELSEIFDFRYEKNLNGSYRVNTVIACVVYPELYTNEDFTEKDIGYFLKHSDFTYQHYPNIRNSFSELMNPKDGSTRFPVAEFADRIVIKCMYSYYKELIEKLDTDHRERLNAFIENTMETESMLHSKFKLFCSENYEFLTWIIIFSMFNKTLSEDKLKNYMDGIQEPTDIVGVNELSAHNLSIELQKNSKKINILTALLVISVCTQLVMAFLPQFSDTHAGNFYYIGVLLYIFVTVGIWILHGFSIYKHTTLKTLFHFKNTYPNFDEDSLKKNFMVRPHNSSFEKKRIKFRKFYFTVCLSLCTLSVIPAVIFKSFPLFTGLVLSIILIYLCADRIVSSYLYRTFYDGRTAKDKPNPYRGLAKIYRWEYEKTKFNFKDNTIPTVFRFTAMTVTRIYFILPGTVTGGL